MGPVRIIIGMYQVQKTVINDGKETLWSLWETKSDQIIGAFFTQAQAREAQKFFTEGGGFNGFTPAFMLHKPYKPKNVDTEFVIELGE